MAQLSSNPDNLPADKLLSLAEIVATESVRRVGDILLSYAMLKDEGPVPIQIFADALLKENEGLGQLESVNPGGHAKEVNALKYLAGYRDTP